MIYRLSLNTVFEIKYRVVFGEEERRGPRHGRKRCRTRQNEILQNSFSKTNHQSRLHKRGN